MPASRWGGASLIAVCEGVDVSCDVTSIDVNRGRTRLWDAMQATTATVRINVGVSAGQPRSRGPIGASMVIDVAYGAVRRHLFTGSVQLRQAESTPGGTVLALDCVDAFQTLARRNLIASPLDPTVGAGETITARLDRWLTLAGWSFPRALDTVAATTPPMVVGGNVLAELQRTAAADGGDFYIDTDATATFKSWAWRNTVTTPAAVLSDVASSDWVPYSAASLRDDLDEIQNDVMGVRRTWDTSTGAVAPVPQIATHPASVTEFGPLGDPLRDLELETDPQVADRVAKVITVAAGSSTRFDPVVVQPELMPARSWPRVLGVRFGSLVITNRHWTDGTVTSLYGHVIGERWRLDPTDATITYRLSGTQTWDAFGGGRGLENLVYDPLTGKWCIHLGFPCPTGTIIAYAADHTTILATFPASDACYCETGGGIILPDGTAYVGLDNGSGVIVIRPIDDPRLKAVLWFMVLDATFEMFEQIDHELVVAGPGFADVTPSVITGGQAVNATTGGGIVATQTSDHLAAAHVNTGWTVDFWYYQTAAEPAMTVIDIINLGTVVVRLTPVYDPTFGLYTHSQLGVGVIGPDPAHPSDPPALHLTGPLVDVDPDAWHHYVITWEPAALTVVIDGIGVV